MKQWNHLRSLYEGFTCPESTVEVIKPENTSMKMTKECCICLEIPKNEKSKPSIWNHLFCYTCLKSWWNVTNAWPLCKIQFPYIVILNEKGAEMRREKVEDKKPGTELDYLNQIAERWYVWNRSDSEDALLICDYWDYNVWHTYWDNLDAIPDSEWFCDICRQIPPDQIAERLLEYEYSSDSIEEESDHNDLVEESENDEEYDPNNDTINNSFRTRENRELRIKPYNIFDNNIWYDYDDGKSFIVDDETSSKSEWNMKRRTKCIYTNDNEAMGQFDGRSFRKRSMKARSKCIEDSESEKDERNQQKEVEEIEESQK